MATVWNRHITGKWCHLKKTYPIISLVYGDLFGAGICPHQKAWHALPRLNTNTAQTEAVTAKSPKNSFCLFNCVWAFS